MKQTNLLTTTQKVVSSEETSVNAQLLTRAGYVDKLMAGVYSYLPLGVKVLAKIENIIREEMSAFGSQEVLLPSMHPRENWEATGRWGTLDVLFQLKGSGDRDLALGPTHEEVISPIIGKFVKSYRNLPTSVFQIQTKFRNEPRAKSGLLRGREFRMKDMYSFHANQADLEKYYEASKEVYERIFTRLGLGEKTYLTYAGGGSFSKYSHEFQTITEHGEDSIHVCEKCHVAVNKEILADLSSKCPECGSASLVEKKAIEVGNIFMLGTRFTDAFNANYQDQSSGMQKIWMGCYGIGSSRLMGSIVEILHDEKGICWPKSVAPFDLHLLSLFKNQAESAPAEQLYNELRAKGFDVLFDDRIGATAGEKFADSDLLGIPVRVVVSPKSLEKGGFEVRSRTEKEGKILDLNSLLGFL